MFNEPVRTGWARGTKGLVTLIASVQTVARMRRGDIKAAIGGDSQEFGSVQSGDVLEEYSLTHGCDDMADRCALGVV